ncbi:hypothetical protein [Pseudonocardia humida]|uniref:Uncharacterized protein n=1 Tax=Pseudonocardia humida TaxID=2800819 RepID=A0ABT1ADN9_9PSEU|nr:hypothetical protein [Pseudonocardia humida]MCO1661118.1 hypothetical protein [Pseudonocardia humida]
MRTTTRVRLSHATAERLLDDAVVGVDGELADLGKLLVAAAAFGTVDELIGEAAALAAFAAARCTVPVRVRPSGRRFRGARCPRSTRPRRPSG